MLAKDTLGLYTEHADRSGFDLFDRQKKKENKVKLKTSHNREV